MRFVLDSTVLIDALRGRSAAERIRELRREGHEAPWTTPINVEEIYRGMRQDEEQRVDLLIKSLKIAPVSFDEARMAGSWRRNYATRGITLSQADCLIAAATHSIGATLATGNPKDFPMPELSLSHWPTGE